MTWASYSRVSSDGQAGLDKYGLERQDSANERYVRSQGFRGDILKFRDVISGTKESRTDFEKLLAAARAGKVRRVVIPDPSRLAREVFVGVALVFELWNAGLEVHHTKKGVLDRTRGDSRRDFITDLVRADADRETLTTQMYEGKLEKARQGKPVAPLNCYGWTRGEINHAQAETVRWIFARAQHVGLVTIAFELTERGIPAPLGGMWQHSTLRQIITNPVYRGEYGYGRKGERLTVAVPALVSLEEWHAANKAIRERRKGFGLRGSRLDKFQLQGRIACGKCGSAMVGWTPNTRTLNYYVCNGSRWRKKDAGRCDHRTVYRAETIHDAVARELERLAVTAEGLEAVLPAPPPAVDMGHERERLLQRLRRAEAAYLAGIRDLAWYSEQTRDTERRIQELEKRGQHSVFTPSVAEVHARLRNAVKHASLHETARHANLRVRIAPGGLISLELG